MSWRGKILVGGLLTVFFFAFGLGPLLSPLLYTLTPLQREYLTSYMASSWSAHELGAETEIRWILKVAPKKPEPKPKRGRLGKGDAGPEIKVDLALAREQDLEAKPVTDLIWAGDAVPFRLSDQAAREGWTGLTWGYRQHVASSDLYPFLREQYFDGRSWISFFVGPLVALLSLFLLVVIGVNRVEAWQESRRWGQPIYRPGLLWRWMLESPVRVFRAEERRLSEPDRAVPLTLAAPVATPSVRLERPVVKEEVASKPAAPKASPAVQTVPSPPPAAPEKAPQPFLWDETAGID